MTHLSKVELGVLLGRDTLKVKQGGVGTGVALAALVAENASLRVESMKITEPSKSSVFREPQTEEQVESSSSRSPVS